MAKGKRITLEGRFRAGPHFGEFQVWQCSNFYPGGRFGEWTETNPVQILLWEYLVESDGFIKLLQCPLYHFTTLPAVCFRLISTASHFLENFRNVLCLTQGRWLSSTSVLSGATPYTNLG